MSEKYRKFAIAPMMDWTDGAKNAARSIPNASGLREVVPSLYRSDSVSHTDGLIRGASE